MTRLERFTAKYRIDASGCWLWIGAKYYNGYGVFTLDDGNHTAHRAAWLLLRGPIPHGMDVCHHCDVRACVNPAHLFLGTPSDNMLDCVTKGRYAHPNRVRRGKLNGRVKLTEDDVRQIRASTERQIDIAARYGIRQAHVSAIKLRQSWAHLP